MSTIVELKVISHQKRLAKQKGTFTVEYEGKSHKVPMFAFQETEDIPKTIKCKVGDNGVIEQDINTLFKKFYPDTNKPYTFKIKNKWPTLKHYVVVDPRIEKDDIQQKLPFTRSSPDLEIGQNIRCRIKAINEGKLTLQLEDRNAVLIDFFSLDDIFNEKTKNWLEILFEENQMADIKNLYGSQNSLWILLFAKEIERIVYRLLAEVNEKESRLRDFCTSWLNIVEHSPFMAEINDEQTKTYSKDLASSIEICEDFLDALNISDNDDAISETIKSLDPRFYQFREEKRLRFLACAFSLNFSQLERNIQPMLEMIKAMGESKCSDDHVAVALTYILKLYANKVAVKLENTLSRDSNDTMVIKRCALSLCYLMKILHKRGDAEVAIYTSMFYQILSLSNIFPKEEKQKLLKNSYTALFLNKCPLTNLAWENLEKAITDNLYLFRNESVAYDKNLRLVYSNGNTNVEITNNGFSMAPKNTDESHTAYMRLNCGLSANLCYDKSLSKFSNETNFGNIQNTWSMVERSVFAIATANKPIARKVIEDGDDIDIYITEINEHKIVGKTVDSDEEGEMNFNELFFSNKPILNIDDFMGADGSPLLIPAIYHNKNGQVTFSSQSHKIDYARDAMPRGEGMCYVTTKNKNNYIGISPKGFSIDFVTDDENVKVGCFVNVDVSSVKKSGHADAEFCGIATNTFDNGKSYRNYLKGLNKYFFNDKEETLNSFRLSTNDEQEQAHVNSDRPATERHIRTLANIISKMARMESELRNRYGYFAICNMLSKLIQDEMGTKLYSIKMKYTKLLYEFSINNRLIDMDVTNFVNDLSEYENIWNVKEMMNVVKILGRYGKTIGKGPDNMLLAILTTEATPLEKELSWLVLSNNVLFNFKRKAVNQILDEIGEKLNINIVKREPTNIGLEEGQTIEFKTSIVYPPTNDGNEDIELQSENIARVLSAMMNTEGGTLYIGVNDVGNVVGLQCDLEYFSEGKFEEVKARDLFRNHFSCFLTNKFGATTASKFKYDFEDIEGYSIFKVDIPKLPGEGGDYIRVGTTCQKKNPHL